MRFQDIPGHKKLKQKLVEMQARNQVAHAQLFHETDGSGALALILAFIQFLNCKNPTDSDSCGTCPACHKLEKNIHPDLHFSYPVVGPPANVNSSQFLSEWQEFLKDEPFGNLNDWNAKLESGNKQALINVHEAGAIRKYLSLKPLESKYRVVVIWHAERMNSTAANKLLKSIEEPPENTFFFLHTTKLEQLLGTIISRTQLVQVKPVMLDELYGFFSDKDEQQVASAYQQADGNLNQITALLKDGELMNKMESVFVAWMRRCFKADVAYLIDWSDGISKNYNREEQKQFLNFCLQLFRAAILKNFNAATGPALIKEEGFSMDKFAPFIHSGNVMEIVELFNEASYHIERNASSKIIFFDLSLKLTKLLRIKEEA